MRRSRSAKRASERTGSWQLRVFGIGFPVVGSRMDTIQLTYSIVRMKKSDFQIANPARTGKNLLYSRLPERV
jgi:hypothetical protein